MALERYSNNFSTTLTADPGAAGTTLNLAATAGLTATNTGIPTQTRVLVDDEIMIVSAVLGATSVTVIRGAEGTTPATHQVGATVRQIVTRDALLANANPGGLVTTLATGAQTYTPTMAVKYHFLVFPSTAVTTLTINAPTAGPVPVEIGDELRIHFQMGTTARAHTLAWGGGTSGVYGVISPAFTLVTTASAGSSISFAYNGSGLAAVGSWKRIN